jgi:hypothetical protein
MRAQQFQRVAHYFRLGAASLPGDSFEHGRHFRINPDTELAHKICDTLCDTKLPDRIRQARHRPHGGDVGLDRIGTFAFGGLSYPKLDAVSSSFTSYGPQTGFGVVCLFVLI